MSTNTRWLSRTGPNLILGIALIFLCTGFTSAGYGISVRAETYVVAGAALLTGMSGLMIAWVYISQKEDSSSKDALDQAREAMNSGWAMIADNNNDRVRWIAAARMFAIASKCLERMDVQSHRDGYFIVKYDIGRRILDHLDNTVSPRPASFWYGCKEALPLDEAARQSSVPAAGAQENLTSDIHDIPEHVIALIYRFARLDRDFEDPLDRTAQFDDKELMFLPFINEPLTNYIEHCRIHQSMAGKLYRRVGNDLQEVPRNDET